MYKVRDVSVEEKKVVRVVHITHIVQVPKVGVDMISVPVKGVLLHPQIVSRKVARGISATQGFYPLVTGVAYIVAILRVYDMPSK